MKFKELALLTSLIALTEIAFAQDQFSNAGITIGGTSNWYWRTYRASSGPFNQSLLFAQTGSTSTENIRARLTQWGGLSLGTTTIGSNQMLAVAGESYFGGYVGIGATSPNLNLHIEESSNGQVGLRIRNSNSGSNAYTSLRLNNSDGTASSSQALLFLNSPTRSGDGDTNTLTLRNNIGDTRIQSQGQKVMIVKANTGNVGIGTNNPDAKLSIRGSSSNNVVLQSWTESSDNQEFALYGDFFGTGSSGNRIRFGSGINDWDSNILVLQGDGKVGIGTLDFSGDHKLRVEGSIGAREIKVESNGWSDFVFESDYELRTLEELEQHIAERGHLPEIPSEAEVTEDGINLGEMNAKLLMKIEELTLYLIQQNKQNQIQQKEIQELRDQIQQLKDE